MTPTSAQHFFSCPWDSAPYATGVHKIKYTVKDEKVSRTFSKTFSLSGEIGPVDRNYFIGRNLANFLVGVYIFFAVAFFLFLVCPRIVQFLYTHYKQRLNNKGFGPVSAAWVSAVDVCFDCILFTLTVTISHCIIGTVWKCNNRSIPLRRVYFNKR